MGQKVLIYENGQVYEIDSDLIYIPDFTPKEDKNETDAVSEILSVDTKE